MREDLATNIQNQGRCSELIIPHLAILQTLMLQMGLEQPFLLLQQAIFQAGIPS